MLFEPGTVSAIVATDERHPLKATLLPGENQENPMAEIVGLHHLSLTVRDIDRSTGWYTQVLGLTKVFEHADRDQGWVKVQLVHPTNGLRLSFTAHEGNLGEPFSELHTGMDHVAFSDPDNIQLEVFAPKVQA